MKLFFAALIIVAAVATLHALDVDASQKERRLQQHCTLEDGDTCGSTSPGGDGEGDDAVCRGWAREEAASEQVPDWLERLRTRHPCPADAKAAAAAVAAIDATWKEDFCCSGSEPGWLMSMATGWAKRWLCGGSSCGYHIGADFCVRSAPLALPDGTSARQQCCYQGNSGRLLTDPTAGAGTADRRADALGHWSVDVKPFLACCQRGSDSRLMLASSMCRVYFGRRPPNTGVQAA